MVEVPRAIIGLNSISTIIVVLLLLGVYTGYAQVDIPAKHSTFEEKTESEQFTISREMADILNGRYASTDREIAACISPRQIVKKSSESLKVSYLVETFETEPKTYGEDFSEIGYCSQGVLHSHPKGSCYFSLSDIYSFQERIKKGEYFSVLMCGEDQFIYITRNDFEEKKMQIV